MEIWIRVSSERGWVSQRGRFKKGRGSRRRREEVEEAAHDIVEALVHAFWLLSTVRFLHLVTASAFLHLTSLILSL